MTDSTIDGAEARRRFGRAAVTYGDVAVLAREVERRMADRLQYLKNNPARIVDAGCGPGDGLKLLRDRYPKARLTALDVAHAMARCARNRYGIRTRAADYLARTGRDQVCAELTQLPFASESVGMVWSNLVLPWVADPQLAFSEVRRILEPNGLFMFSTYGPDTLKELRSAFAGVDGYPHVHRFVDMHDLGDMLGAAGFADPVMDMDLVTLAYGDVAALVRDMRLSGQSNVDSRRRRGLMGPGAWAKMIASYELYRRDGRLPATFEIVYGHAWKGRLRPRKDGGQVVLLPYPGKKSN